MNGLGEVTSELDPFLAQLVMEATKDADGTKHAAVLNDPVLHRVLEAEGIHMRVKCGGTTTARVGGTKEIRHSEFGVRNSADRQVRFQKTYA